MPFSNDTILTAAATIAAALIGVYFGQRKRKATQTQRQTVVGSGTQEQSQSIEE